jgi:hypothetical protein
MEKQAGSARMSGVMGFRQNLQFAIRFVRVIICQMENIKAPHNRSIKTHFVFYVR